MKTLGKIAFVALGFSIAAVVHEGVSAAAFESSDVVMSKADGGVSSLGTFEANKDGGSAVELANKDGGAAVELANKDGGAAVELANKDGGSAVELANKDGGSVALFSLEANKDGGSISAKGDSGAF
jgi:hypothetical protein